MSGLITAAFVRYVERARGPVAAARVAAAVGRVPSDFTTAAWFTVADTRVVAGAAAVECNDRDIGRRAGEAAFWDLAEQGLDDFLIQSGSPEAAIALLVEVGARTTMDRQFAMIACGTDHAVVEGAFGHLVEAIPEFCAFPAAIFSLIPSLFGFTGTATETLCQCRGDERCRWEVRWHPSARNVERPDIAASEARVEAALGQFEALRQMAAELAKIDDVSLALAKITEQASATVMAPRYLLSVTLDDAEEPRVHAYGFPVETALDELAQTMCTSGTIDGHDALVVEVATGRRHYGYLAAAFLVGRTFLESDRRLFEAYAGHAAAALDSLVALDTARRHRDTSSALLELARTLAEVRTSQETVDQLVAAMRPVLGCTSARIWLHDDGGLEIVGAIGTAPVLVDVVDAPGAISESLPPTIVRVAIAPISVRDEVLGVAVAGFTSEQTPTNERDLVPRLVGLTDHAATALDNARLLERVHHDALHDRLTGLPNRALIEDRAATALARAERDDQWPSVLFVDLDRFKNVNDTLGHGAGDTLIRQVAHRIRSTMRKQDTLGRLGGDEFVVLLEGGLADVDAETTAERLGAAMRAPFVVDGHELFISCSIGIAMAPDDGVTYEELLQHADVAMYDAKDRGRATFAVYAPPRSEPRRDRLELESRLHRAVDNGEIVVLYQPQVDLTTLEVVGTEALVRWDHPDLGRLTPDRFLPLAEESGVIVDIDRWVRAEAFAQSKRWLDAGYDWQIAINVSTRDLQKPDIAGVIAAEIAAAGISPDRVEVEVTDRVVLDDESLTGLVARLRDVGLRVAIDDFGTGTSVLGRLRSCSVDTLKIDRSFVAEIGTAGGDTIVRALVSLGRSLDLNVVAEGIETDAHLSLLRRLGCPLGQGYAFSRPVEAMMLTAAGYTAMADMPSMSAKLRL